MPTNRLTKYVLYLLGTWEKSEWLFTFDHSPKFQTIVTYFGWPLHDCSLHGIDANGLGSAHISSPNNSFVSSNDWHTTFLSCTPPPHNSEHWNRTTKTPCDYCVRLKRKHFVRNTNRRIRRVFKNNIDHIDYDYGSTKTRSTGDIISTVNCLLLPKVRFSKSRLAYNFCGFHTTYGIPVFHCVPRSAFHPRHCHLPRTHKSLRVLQSPIRITKIN